MSGDSDIVVDDPDSFISPIYISSEDIRQYIYCARIPFFRTILRFRPIITPKMGMGQGVHHEIHKFSLPTHTPEKYPERYVNLYLQNPSLKVHGQIDMIEISTEAGEIDPTIPVNFTELQETYPDKQLGCIVEIKTGKETSLIPSHHKAQVIFQAILVESNYAIHIYAGKIFNTQTSTINCFRITPQAKEWIKTVIKNLQFSYQTELLPAPTLHEGKCTNCEYWPICQGV